MTREQINRQDLVDNAIYQMIHDTNPIEEEIPFDIEMIGMIRDTVEKVLIDFNVIKTEAEYYP